MACGTGKTFTALKLAEQESPKGGLVLFPDGKSSKPADAGLG
jgi:predicted helicase